MACGEFQPSWIRHFQFQCLRDLRRWRPDGGCGERSCFARGTSEALQSLLDLRQQQGDPRWSRRVVLQRRCDDAFQGLRLERRARDGRQRFGPPGARLRQFSQSKDQPTLIVVDSHIGYGSPHKQDSYEANGEPVGEAEVKLVKKNYGWPEEAKFLVPDGVYDQFKNGIGKRGAEARAAWKAKFEEYKKQFPQQADQLNRMETHQLPDGWDKD